MYEKGTKLITSHLMRQLPEAKTINYAAGIVEVQRANKAGAADVLHTDAEGNMYESTRSNQYGVKDGRIITTDTGVLKGITRKVILDIAKNLSIDVDLRFVTKEEIPTLDEAFISNSSYELLSVVEIDGIIIGNGMPGVLTQKVHEAFRKEIR